MNKYSLEEMDSFYNKIVADSPVKHEMNSLLRLSRRELKIRIDECTNLLTQFSPSGKTNTRINFRIWKIRWAIQKNKISKKSPAAQGDEGKSLK